MENKNQYWRGLEELNNDPKFLESKKHEFAEGIPLEEVFTEEDGNLNSNRRDFLKFFGFSISAVALAACNKAPVKNVIPYVVKPENITPGIPNWYASTCNACAANCSILVKTREGRPIKIEGNADSPVFKGAVCASGQGSLLGLYDNERLRGPKANNADISWDKIDAEIATALAGSKSIALVTGTLNSPSTNKAIAEFTTKYPQAKVIQYEAFSVGALAAATKEAYGINAVPGYRFDMANVIVSFGADFLGTWISPAEFTKQWSKNRSAENKKMSRHIQIESNLSITGSNADVRYPIKPSAEGAYVISLYNKIAALAGAPALGTLPPVELPVDGIANAAKELWANKGNSLVVSGSNIIGIQMVVHAINQMLGNVGTTVDLVNHSKQHFSDDAAFSQLVKDLNAGATDAVIFYNTNPVYSYPQAAQLVEGIKKAKVSIASNSNLDETSSLCNFQVPDSHFLESWNDAEPKAGYYTFTQPSISTVFNTRQMQESLLAWSGNKTNFYDYMVANWSAKLNGDNWSKAIHDGFYMEARSGAQPAMTGSAAGVESMAYELYTNNKSKMELNLYAKVSIGDGTHAHNPWLQEVPDPISKVAWDNYACISNATAKELGVKDGDKINLSCKDGKIENLPVLVQPGQPNNVIGVAVGYGRTAGGKSGLNVGVNAYPLAAMVNGAKVFMNVDVKVEKAAGTYELAQTQTHHTIEGRALIKEASLGEYLKDAKAGNHDHHKSLKENGTLLTLWSERDSKGHRWTMAVDLNKCTGCAACVVSCNAENNVPVVGRQEVLNRREMHWMRIDRYYRFKDKDGKLTTREKSRAGEILKKESEGLYDYNDPESVNFEDVAVTFQPVMCQQCGHAPCETVCPVLATVHSSEGLNHMAYNRCVGTRYCANNCPYKVRRFNWFKYRDNSQFDFNFNNDLGRMVINPDVTVRSRGVMEKCSFCVQRIQAGKLKAKMENRAMVDGDVKTACQQSCPADAIIFGDINDKSSEVRKYFENERAYFMLEEYSVQPSVAYMTKVRNVEEELVMHHAPAKHENHKAEEKAEHHS